MMRLTGREILTAVLAVVVVGFAYGVIRQSQADATDGGGAAGRSYQVTPSFDASAAPDFAMSVAKTGATMRLADATKNGPVVLDFWATWCGPCQMELPELDQVYAKYHARGVEILGINSDATAAEVNQFFRKTSVGFPMLVDTGGDVHAKYGVTGIPLTVVIDRHGRIRSVNEGFDPTTQADLAACLDQLLKEN